MQRLRALINLFEKLICRFLKIIMSLPLGLGHDFLFDKSTTFGDVMSEIENAINLDKIFNKDDLLSAIIVTKENLKTSTAVIR